MPAMNFFQMLSLLALSALTLAPLSSAHSWIEEYQVIDSNGSYIGDMGYSRGYMARTDPGYNGFSMEYLVPQEGVRINSTTPLCHPSQRTSNYSNPAYPKLNVAPGQYVAMKYLENGHVTLLWNQLGKPVGGGSVFVYGTTQPSDSETIANVLQWTTDGKGGDAKGWLMTAQNFDDGRCHQINCGNISIDRQILFPAHVEGQPTSSVEQWCETDLKIPESQPIGTLTTYWVWQWPTEPNHDCTYPDGKDEYYTTCTDFDIVSPGSGNGDAKIAAESLVHTLEQQNPQSTAVSTFTARHAYTTSPPIIMMSGTVTKGQSTTASPAFMSECSASVNMAPKVDVPASCPVISVFSGALHSSAAAAVKEFATTLPFNALTATSTPPSEISSATPSASAVQQPAASEQPTYTLSSTTSTTTTSTTTITMSPSESVVTVYDTVYASPSSTSAQASASVNVPNSAPISSSAAEAASMTVASTSLLSNSITFSTISTAIASEAAAPTATVSNVAEDVAVSSNGTLAVEHAARHMRRRAHPRHFI